MERLQKILSAQGIASRRQAEQMILAGRVTVDGRVAALGETADLSVHTICVDGKPLAPKLLPRVYRLLHKPKGYLSTVRDDRGRPTVMDLLGEQGRGLWPVGRLDLDSEGLLILTNDGDFTQTMTHPSHGVEKTYHVWVSGGNLRQKAEEMAQLTQIEEMPIAPAKVRVLTDGNGANGQRLEVKIRQGLNRQVRKMCKAVGLEVRRLVRVAEGSFQLGDLPPGEWRELEV